MKALGVTCKQVLRMGRDKFFAYYERKRADGRDRVPMHLYAHCRREDNDSRARGLAPGLRKRFVALRKILAEWEEGGRVMGYGLSRGDTVHLDLAADYDATREDALGGLILLLQRPSRSIPSARARANQWIDMAQAALPAFNSRRSKVEGDEYQKINDKDLAGWTTGLAKLKASLDRIPDEAAGKIAVHVEQVIECSTTRGKIKP